MTRRSSWQEGVVNGIYGVHFASELGTRRAVQGELSKASDLRNEISLERVNEGKCGAVPHLCDSCSIRQGIKEAQGREKGLFKERAI